MTQPVRYEFVCQGLPPETFSVNRIQGEEALSALYRFEIELRTPKLDVDAHTLLTQSCRLGIWINGEERKVHGILSDCDMLQKVGEYVIYRVVLVPRLWQLSLYHSNEVFLGKSVPDILRQVLNEGGFSSLDYQLDLIRNYRKWPYRCQYSETHLDYLQRLMEREGMYYFFDQSGDSEKLIIVDHLQFHDDMPSPKIIYDPVSGLEGEQFGSSVQSFVCRQKRVAKSVMLRDYNDESPSVDIKGSATVDASGVGEVNIFGLNIISPDEGSELAEIHAEQIRCTRQVFHAESTVGRVIPGYSCKLDRHFRSAFNQAYLVTSVTHSGIDPTLLSLGTPSDRGDVADAYRNSFTAIPADIQYRPDPIPARTQIHGTLDAVIDAEGDGEYAEVDAEGRYKVILPFDRQIRDEGKASHWIRMSQTFAGEREGMHFPLRKGAHVLLSFVGGDPDRPIITGSMPNSAQPSVVTSDNQTKSKIQTRAGNFIEIEDKSDSNRIKLYSPHKNTYFHLGAHNAPGDGVVAVTEGIERKEIGGGSQSTMVTADKLEEWKAANDASVITNSDDQLFNEQELFEFTILNDAGKGTTKMTSAHELTGNYHIVRRVGDYYIWTDGNEYSYGGGNSFSFGNSYEEAHALGESVTEETFDMPTSMPGAVSGGYNLETGLVSKTWANTYEYSSGCNYAWGDTCDYEFGNGYAEAHVECEDDGRPKNAINKTNWEHDLCGAPPFAESGYAINGRNVKLNSNTCVVEKTFGNGYAYTKGHSLEVSVGNAEAHSYGNSYEYQHGGRQEEEVYSDSGILLTKTHSFNGTEHEWTYHPLHGALTGFTASTENGLVNFESKLMPTFGTTVDVSSLSTEIEIGINAFSANFTASDISMELQGLKVELTLEGWDIIMAGTQLCGGTLEIEQKLSQLEQKATSLETKATEVSTGLAELKTKMTTLENGLTKVQNEVITLMN